MTFASHPICIHITMDAEGWGLRMSKTTYKEQTIETACKMGIVLRQLLLR
jgi:hypothetical protein